MDTQKIKEFVKLYWNHYLSIEDKVLATDNYLTIDKDNAKAFSNEYFTLYQIIGSEIDVLAKIICNFLKVKLKKENINHYCKAILTSYPNFTNNEIYIFKLENSIKPWKEWSYKTSTDKNGKESVTGNPPKWWTLYNKTKHSRSTALASNNYKPFYKFANQENIIESLAALYNLNMFYYKMLLDELNPIGVGDHVIQGSKMFILDEMKLFYPDNDYSIFQYKNRQLYVRNR